MKFKLEGAHRACSPEDTIERMKPFFEMAGITRVGDITGLDRIGIPVAQCIRPDAISLVVDSGKGSTPIQARCSAIMEGFERHIAETANIQFIDTSESNLLNCETRFPMFNGAPYIKDVSIKWTSAKTIYSQKETYVPLNCVKMIPRNSLQSILSANFSSNSNGLSSGNTLEESICGGLYEVIERDQVTRVFCNPALGSVVDIDLIQDEHLNTLIEKIRSKDVNVILFDCTGDIGVPTYMCYLWDNERGNALCRGYAAHLNPVIAQSRAICEAIQGRVVWIAGSRDDITHEKFIASKNDDTTEMVNSLKNWKPQKHIERPDMSGNLFSDDIAKILLLLEKTGIPEPLICEFQHPYPCSAVRVMIPTLEGYYNNFIQRGTRSVA